MWKTPRSALLFILSIELLCVTTLATANIVMRPTLSDFGRFALLGVVAIAYAEGGKRVERVRRYLAGSTFSNATSLWCFAAALILPAGLAGCMAALLYGHALLTGIHDRSARPFRLICTASTEILAAMAAAVLLARFGADHSHLGTSVSSALAVVLALLTYAAVNQTLVTVAIYLVARPVRFADVMLSRDDQTLELATLGLAVLFAVALVHAPFLAPVTLLLIVVLRRSALVRELQVQATRDAKTGLLNAGGWRQEAEREIVRTERVGGWLGVLMVDLDHFKLLNDTYGHPAGDAALKAVADCLGEALRGYDAVGRYGGEEFIALLADADERVSKVVADRLCSRIRSLKLAHGGTVTASIGVSVGTADVHTLDELIAGADRALYVAKGAGRDQVHVALAPPRPRLNVAS